MTNASLHKKIRLHALLDHKVKAKRIRGEWYKDLGESRPVNSPRFVRFGKTDEDAAKVLGINTEKCIFIFGTAA